MAWLHTWAGLVLGWVLFFIFLTGTAGYFDTEIDRWMHPELPRDQTYLPTGKTAAILLSRLEKEAPEAKRWFISLPVNRNTPYPSIFWQGASTTSGASAVNGSMQVDGETGKSFHTRDSGGGQLLYQMHWRLHYFSRIQADVIVGFAALFMLVALITGIIVHKKIFKDFFTFRPGKGQRTWLDAHNVLGVIALPFHLMITYSGLVFMGFSYMPLIVAAHYGTNAGQQQFNREMFNPPGLIDPAHTSAPLANLNAMITFAETRWSSGQVHSVDIRHPGDQNARIIIQGSIDGTITSSSERLLFDGVSGELLHDLPATTSTAQGTRDMLIGLHEGLFAPWILRWLYFLSGLLGTAMIATGLILWTAKRRQQASHKFVSASHNALALVEKLNLGTVIGLPIGIAAYFWANRLLPLNITDRSEWEAHTIFLVWLAMLIHAVWRPIFYAWIEQLVIAAALFGLLPILNFLTTDRHLGQSLAVGDWVFAGFDLVVLTIGLMFIYAAWQTNCTKRTRQSSISLTTKKAGSEA